MAFVPYGFVLVQLQVPKCSASHHRQETHYPPRVTAVSSLVWVRLGGVPCLMLDAGLVVFQPLGCFDLRVPPRSPDVLLLQPPVPRARADFL